MLKWSEPADVAAICSAASETEGQVQSCTCTGSVNRIQWCETDHFVKMSTRVSQHQQADLQHRHKIQITPKVVARRCLLTMATTSELIPQNLHIWLFCMGKKKNFPPDFAISISISECNTTKYLHINEKRLTKVCEVNKRALMAAALICSAFCYS